MARSIDHSSTLTMVQTAMRAPPGSESLGRSTMAEYGTRSRGSFMQLLYWGHRREEINMLKSMSVAALVAACFATNAAAQQTVGFATLQPGTLLNAQASVIAKVVQD